MKNYNIFYDVLYIIENFVEFSDILDISKLNLWEKLIQLIEKKGKCEKKILRILTKIFEK
jgi:hypothetical protein